MSKEVSPRDEGSHVMGFICCDEVTANRGNRERFNQSNRSRLRAWDVKIQKNMRWAYATVSDESLCQRWISWFILWHWGVAYGDSRTVWPEFGWWDLGYNNGHNLDKLIMGKALLYLFNKRVDKAHPSNKREWLAVTSAHIPSYHIIKLFVHKYDTDQYFVSNTIFFSSKLDKQITTIVFSYANDLLYRKIRISCNIQ